MPFTLSHKASKPKLRRPVPAQLDLSNPIHSTARNTAISITLPTPPPSADSPGFRMFWRKKSPSLSPPSPRPVYPNEAPRPILKTTEGSRGPSIRFVGERRDSDSEGTARPRLTTPRVVLSSYEGEKPLAMPVPSVIAPTARRSSRPTSPSANSFGARVRQSTGSMPGHCTYSAPLPFNTQPLSTPPLPAHITTPPTAYVSTMQSRAPPPQSPYRPTNDRHRSSSSFSRSFPGLLPTTSDMNMAARPPRHSSLFPSDSMATIPDQTVPMLNIIPATPQDASEEFVGAWAPPSWRHETSLAEAVKLDEMEEVALDIDLPKMPSIDVQLDFSPFQPLVDLPTSSSLSNATAHPPLDGLPPPPFESYSSLPSLESHNSMPSTASERSMPSSSSSSSLMSFPDVEKALGSMLASLSENDLPEAHRPVVKPKRLDYEASNPGLGLGLDFDMPTADTITAPLSPRRRRAPSSLDLSNVRRLSTSIQSAPCINHRAPFYGSTKPAPNSPTSGIFTIDLSLTSPMSSMDLGHGGGYGYENPNEGGTDLGFHTSRDSMSLTSEASDDDLHTASIINLAPIGQGKVVEVKKEVMLPGEAEVGLAF